MSELLAYERDPFLRRLEVRVTHVGREGERDYVVLEDTLFYPEGGGQPADRGRIADSEVVDVQRTEGEVRHYLSAPLPLGPARAELDWERRHDHMQQHTAQHLLTAVAADRFGWATTSFHLGAERCDIELDVESLNDDQLTQLEGTVAEELWKGHRVRSFYVDQQEYARHQVRSRGLPRDHRGDVRLVEIEGVDLCTCGGTHLADTAAIETIKLLGTESLRGGTRLFWVAGGRVRRLLAQHEARAARLRQLLGCGDDEVSGVLASKLERLKHTERRVRELEKRLATQAASSLVTSSERVAEAHFDLADAGFLQQVGRQFAAAAGDRLALLTATNDGGNFFLLAVGEQCDVDLRAVGPQVAELLGGRGGGSGSLFQGKATSLAGRPAALDLLRNV